MPTSFDSSFLLALFLFAGACVGHGVLVVTSHNIFYGQAFPKRVSDLSHALHFLLALLGPPVFWFAAGWDLTSLFAYSSDFSWRLALGCYVGVCWLTAFVLFPAVTLRRLLRPRPAALVESQSRVLDIAQELGEPPAGRVKDSFICYLPGNEVFQVEMAEHTLRLPRLPRAWDGLTVLHLSDLHLHGAPDRTYFKAVMDHCRAWEPDLVCVTGDVADGLRHLRWVVPVLGRLRWKVAAFAILGNHDSWYDPALLRRRLARVGMHVLGNSWKQLDVRGEPLVVVGNEWPWFGPGPDLSDAPAEPFRLCLSHTPDNIVWARRSNIDLMLSGHVHGGQIRFPLFGSMLVPSRYGRRYDCGAFDEAPTFLYVSRGLGGEHPVRYRCRPEATRLILRCV